MVIDKAKGIIAKPMPRAWHDMHSVNKMEDHESQALYREIVADRKPYFMKYIYPALSTEYNAYIKNTKRSALIDFGMTVDEMQNIPESELTERQREFLKYYNLRMPLGNGDCVMNRICRKFEEKFDGYTAKSSSKMFDPEILKSGAEYTTRQFNGVKKLYEDYNAKTHNYMVYMNTEAGSSDDITSAIETLTENFQKDCAIVCPNQDALCDIVIDICYAKQASRTFAWKMCGEQIIHNLLNKNCWLMEVPVVDDDGEYEYCGMRFSNRIVEVYQDEYSA